MRTHFIRSFAIFFFVVGGCHESGPVDVDHQNGNGTNTGYYLYVGNWRDEVLIVDANSNAVVDTLRGFDSDIWDLAVTNGGTKLYVSTRKGPVNYSGKVYSINLQSRQIKLIHSKVADVYVSPCGMVFIISKDPYQSLRQMGTIDTLTDAINFSDTLDIRDTGYNYQSVVFDQNKSLLYGVNNNFQLFAYDYDEKEIVRIYKNLYGPKLSMVISPDGKTLYAAGGPVFDLERDSVIAGIGGNHLGSLALSPDAELLYITDPGQYMIPEPVPSGKVSMFNTVTKNYVGYIDVNKASGEAYTITDRIVLTPDGKTAYVSRWLEKIFVIDLQVKEVVKVIALPGFTIPMALGRKH